MGKHQQQALPLCMVFLTALLVVSALHAVPAEAVEENINHEALGVRSCIMVHGHMRPPYGEPEGAGGLQHRKCNAPCTDDFPDLWRALGQAAGAGSGALIPGYTPSVPRGEPYTGRGCSKIYGCYQPPAGAP